MRRTILRPVSRLAIAAGLFVCTPAAHAAADDQSGLVASINAESSRVLRYDWPLLQIGTGEYQAGPTGVTVFRFTRKVQGAVDVRGGAPGTVNTDFLRLGYEQPELDAVVFAGGSAYGLESTTAVNTALKDDHVRNGNWQNIGLAVGAIVYDFGARRLNEIYPDKRLAQAAMRAARPGSFPLGAHGAGRMVRSGGFFGCNAYSGQGGAIRQVGDVKVAAFTVVNALGAVTDREGKVAACYKDKGWPAQLRTTDLLNGLPNSRMPGWSGPLPSSEGKNTTVSLIVTNQKMPPSELQRLAVQVHTSMARGIQPFATQSDGDVLYAVSTGEVEPARPAFNSVDVATIAAEAMWDAILSSVPEQPALARPAGVSVADAALLKKYAGDYRFSNDVALRVTAEQNKLYGEAIGELPVFLVEAKKPKVELLPVSATDFTVAGRYPMLLRFDEKGGLVVNPGHWQQTAARAKP